MTPHVPALLAIRPDDSRTRFALVSIARGVLAGIAFGVLQWVFARESVGGAVFAGCFFGLCMGLFYAVAEYRKRRQRPSAATDAKAAGESGQPVNGTRRRGIYLVFALACLGLLIVSEAAAIGAPLLALAVLCLFAILVVAQRRDRRR